MNGNRMRATALLIASAMFFTVGPATVLPLGDEQYETGALADFQAVYDATWGRALGKTHPVPGNHEYAAGANGTGYFDYFGARAGTPGRGWYSYEVGKWHLIALNSNCTHVGGCGPSSRQVTWLQDDLAAHHPACTLAYWHHARFSSGPNGNLAVTTRSGRCSTRTTSTSS